MKKSQLILSILFWLIAGAAAWLIGIKFFAAQEQPMESKILFVFSTFLICALIFRWIRKKAAHPKLERWTNEAIEWSDTGVSAVLLAFVIMAFIVQAFKIPSGSMQPTLLIGDHLFVNKFIYGTQIPFTTKRLWNLKKIQRYDVVVFLCPPEALYESERSDKIQKDFIKRAVGLPGDIVEIRDKNLYVNEQKINDPFASFSTNVIYPRPEIWKKQEEYQRHWEQGQFVHLPIEAIRDNFGPVKVPEGHYFVMGDNRDGSFDSRFWGPLPEKYLKGRAWIVYWPLTRFQIIR